MSEYSCLDCKHCQATFMDYYLICDEVPAGRVDEPCSCFEWRVSCNEERI